MLSANAKVQVGRMLAVIGEEESYLETLRQRISKLDHYSPYAVFLRLDTTNHKYINKHDLFTFLK